MFIGLLRIEMLLPGCSSLKDKRQRMQSVKDRFGRVKNIAVSESAHLDVHQRSELAFVCIANDKSVVEPSLAKISDYCSTSIDAQIINEIFEWL